MKTKVLLFPLSVVAVMALDGCQGVDITDPSVRECRTDTLDMRVTLPDGRVEMRPLMIVHDNPLKCRKAA
jgi:hypothetical protein